jgi:hypothetical protein
MPYGIFNLTLAKATIRENARRGNQSLNLNTKLRNSNGHIVDAR